MREPRNKYEKALWEVLKEGGWELLRNGWPDILAVKDERVAVFEVKAKRSDRLKEDQLKCMDFLSRVGIECFRWDKDAGFQPYGETLPDVKELNRKKRTREERRVAHICPMCGEWKPIRFLGCYVCEKTPWKMQRLMDGENKAIIEQAVSDSKGSSVLE